MIHVGFDVAKDKQDCFITNSDGEVLLKASTISNNHDGSHTIASMLMSDAIIFKEPARNSIGTAIPPLLPTYFRFDFPQAISPK